MGWQSKIIFCLAQISFIVSVIKEVEVEINDDNSEVLSITFNNNVYSQRLYEHTTNRNLSNTSYVSNNTNVLNPNVKFSKNSFLNNENVINVKEEPLSTAIFWTYLIVIISLTMLSGIFSGLTVGYLSIDDLVLELKSQTGTETEKKYARNVLPILAERHKLLVTLLIWNAACLESLPIFLSKINKLTNTQVN